MQEGDVAHHQRDSPVEAKGEAGCAAEHPVYATGASVGCHRSTQP